MACRRGKLKNLALCILTKHDWYVLLTNMIIFLILFSLLWHATESLYAHSRTAAFYVGLSFSFLIFNVFVLHVVVERRRSDNDYKKAAEIKNQFLSIASHELRTPMSAIRGFISFLEDGKYGEINEKQKEVLEKVNRNVNGLLEMIRNLLDISRIEAGRIEYSFSDFDIKKIVEEVQESMQTLSDAKAISFHVFPEKESFFVHADKEKVKRVLNNLVGNAIKFTPEAGKIEIKIEENKEKKMIQCTVTDTGVGIPEKEQPLIFQKFHQIQNSLQKKGEGTGLGLHITKNIIEGMHGNISVKSEEGKGSSFTFSLPLALSFSHKQ